MLDVRLPEFSFAISLYVWYRDLDAMGHVNNATYFQYFEQARTRYWLSLMAGAAHPNPVLAAVGTPVEHDVAKLGIIVVHAECDYVSPARLGEGLLVGVKLTEIRRKSFVLDYKIVSSEKTGSETDSRLVATGKTVQALYDYAKAKSLPFTEDLKKKIEAREGTIKYTDTKD